MSYQKLIIKEWEKKGYDVLKNIRLNKSGYPDLQCLKNGLTVWIEVKEANDTLKELQKLRIDQLRANGFKAFCVQSGKGIIY
jgi:Holliday junction resolvase